MNRSPISTTETLAGEGHSLDVEDIFKLYYSRLCYFAFKMTEQRETGQDIVQDAFIKLWDRWGDFDNELSAKTFLYVTVRNACLNLLRHKDVEKKFIQSADSEEAEEEKVLHDMIRTEVYGEIYRAIEELPQGCKQVLKLAYFEELRNGEIASKLGLSVNTIKTQKARALQLLRMKLDHGAFILLLLVLSHP